MTIIGSKTEKNLLVAFAGESQARNRYTYYAKVAEKEGFRQMAELFRETADNELSHAKTFFKALEGGPVEIMTTFTNAPIGTTLENLKAAATAEHEEASRLYPAFAQVARKEGWDKIAGAFEAIAKVEAAHERRFLKLASNIENDKVFKKDEVVKWKCRKCGFIYEGQTALTQCPACQHPQNFFEQWRENY